MVVTETDRDEAEALVILQRVHQGVGGLLAAHVKCEDASGTIEISERSAYTNIFRESSAPSWDHLFAKGYLKKGAAAAPARSA